ncbi:MAG: hypothetical protein ACHQIG_01550 [Acidimicrobiia bacterium]
MTDDAPSIGTLAGQLGYLFEERPELAHATAAELVDQLNHEDRYARARQTYIRESDEFVTLHLDEFPPRITTDMVAQALAELRRRG